MSKRQWTIIAAVAILAAAVAGFVLLKNQETEPVRKPPQAQLRAVNVMQVAEGDVQARIPVTGRLEAEQRVELFAEVNGIFLDYGKPFKEGVAYEKGEVLITIDSEDEVLALQAQRSNFQNQIMQVLADLKLDYPEVYPAWQEYVNQLDPGEALPALPEVENRQARNFLSARGINNLYYQIQSVEARVANYSVYAPFRGVVTEALINPGTLVRPGQKLGEYIDPGQYELSAAITAQDLRLVDVGDEVLLESRDMPGQWTGEVVRINPRIDPGTQTVQVIVEVAGEGLRDGMYMTGRIMAASVDRAVELPRKLLVQDTLIWTIRDSVLRQMPVEVVQRGNDRVIIRGIPEDITLLSETFPGAYEGLKVRPVAANE